MTMVAGVLACLADVASAYPQMIALGYQSCMGCHYNPFGGGQLTDYGRAVGATALSDRAFLDQDASEEEVAERAAFLRRKPSQDWFRPSLSYRGLYLTTKVNDTIDSEYITMDVNGSLALKFHDERLIAVGSLSYAPTPRAQRGNGKKMANYRSREHYVGYRLSREWGVYAGLMDKVYGLRIPDHVAFSRTLPQVTMNDQTHGIVVHGMFKTFELGLHGFIGNLVQDADLRQQGFSGTAEYSLGKKTRVGASFIYSGSKYLGVDSYAGHVRTGIGEKGALIGEMGWAKKFAIKNGFRQESPYLFLQHYHALRRGLFLIVTGEATKPDVSRSETIYKFGPGVQYFHLGGVELRSDLLAQQTDSSSGARSEVWQLLSQLHVFL